MFIIGITGGTGAGKSTALQTLQALGAFVIDCDKIYHEALLTDEDMKADIKANFSDVLTDGEIDRKKLGEIVWNDPVSLSKLNSITHKYISYEIERHIKHLEEQGGKLLVIDAIALIESGLNQRCDIVVGVTASLEKRLSRIMNRDDLTKEAALNRINAQQPESFYRDNCDYILENIYDKQAAFEDKCSAFFKELISNKNRDTNGDAVT